MAVRTDITVDWHKSPRIITVQAPSVSITLQDLLDTLRELEDSDYGMAFEFLVKASGKEDLGGGVNVGITLELQNAKLAFEPRQDSIESGTITTGDSNGKTLIDTSATFISSGVVSGDSVVNLTDGSTSTVLSVDSENQLTTWILKDGLDNEYGLNDSYKVWSTVQCEVSGGNLVAVDSVGDSMSPIHPTVNTQVNKTASSSATISHVEIDTIETMITDVPENVWTHDPTSITEVNSGAMILRRALGLIHENMFIDSMVYDSNRQLESCRIRVFASKADCEAATNGGNPPGDPQHIAEWTQGSVWGATQGELETFRQVLE